MRSRWNSAALIAAEQVDAAGEVHEGGAGLGRGPVGLPGGRGGAGHRLHGDVHRRHVRVGPRRPVSLAGGDDQTRVVGQEPLRAELESLHGARAKFSMSTSAVSTRSRSASRPASVFRSSTTLRLLELSITNSCDSTGSCERNRNGSPPGLDLDDVGAELCEKQPAVRAVVDLAQFEDPDAVEGLHVVSSIAVGRSSPVVPAWGASERPRRRRAAADVAGPARGPAPPPRPRARYWTVTASKIEWKLPSSLKLTCAPSIQARAMVSSVLSSGQKNVWTEPPGSCR